VVVVALVEEEFVANNPLKIFCALKVLAVVVENAVEMVIAPVEPVVRSGYVAARDETPEAEVR